jgi:CCR4-NOT transcription complex subunit 7/8
VKSQEFLLESPKIDVWSAQQETSHILQLGNTSIVDVYDINFISELEKIVDLSERFNVIAMDTEFPGVVAMNMQQAFDYKDQELIIIRENVNKSKIIQIGISLSDEQGNVPLPVSTWQFNFKFDKDKDTITKDALNLLTEAGINFEKFKREGIDAAQFAEYIMASDLVLNEDIKWVAFHGGFDFGYFLQMLLNQSIPNQSDQFYAQLKTYFPTVYDIKYLIQDNLQIREKGLTYVAEFLGVKRIGPQHQAGSDSLLTLAVYFKLREGLNVHDLDRLEKKANVIYNIGKGYTGGKDYNRISAPQIFQPPYDQHSIEPGGDYMSHYLPLHSMQDGYIGQHYIYAGPHPHWQAASHHTFAPYFAQQMFNIMDQGDLSQQGPQQQGPQPGPPPQQVVPPSQQGLQQVPAPSLSQQSVQLGSVQAQLAAQVQQLPPQQALNSLAGQANSRVIRRQQYGAN